MKKCVVIYFGFINLSFSQTGINTLNPNPSAELDVAATNKGVLLPENILTDLSSNISPINNPQIGALTYNSAGTFSKGFYYWDGTTWNRLIVNREIDQILNLKISGTYFDGPSDQSKQLIPAGTSNNYISFSSANETQYINTMGVTNPNGQNITLPAGTYKVDVSVDCISPSAPTSNYLAGTSHLYVIEAGIVDSANNLITDLKTSSLISGAGFDSVQGYSFSFILKLNSPQIVKLLLKHGAGRTTNVATRTNQSGLTVNFYKFFE